MSKLLQTDKTSEDRPRDKRIKNMHDNEYLASFGRKCIKILLFGLIQLIGSMPLSSTSVPTDDLKSIEVDPN